MDGLVRSIKISVLFILMTLRDSVLPKMERLRIRLADAGFRQYDILMRVVQWTNTDELGTVGEGTKTVTDTNLTIQGRRIKVRRIEQKDVIASGGKWEDVDYRVGPITPTYDDAIEGAVGHDVEYFNPPEPVDGSRQEVYYRLTGPGMEDGQWFVKIGQEVDRNWSYYWILRKTSANP